MPLGHTPRVQSYRLRLVFLLDLRSSPTGNSTTSITPVDPKFGPIIDTLLDSNQCCRWAQCVYGGAAGYRPRVQFVVDSLQRYNAYLSIYFGFCQPKLLTRCYRLCPKFLWGMR